MSTPSPYPSASLYVGDLLPDVTEGILYELFNQVGPVASIRVCRDAITRRSLGYAYINFHTFLDAERALDALNNTHIQGRPCRIMWSQRDPSIRRAGVGNVFIKNLDPEIGHKELHDTFSAFGNILSCKVALNENNQSKGYGFVHFENEESATRAINKANGKLMGTKQVYVGPFISQKERSRNQESMWTNVYVKNLDKDWTDKELYEAFQRWGPITSAKVMFNENGSRGFGFVNFAEHENAAQAVRDTEKSELRNKDGVPLYACRAQKKSERYYELNRKFEQFKIERITKYQGINLYIKNIEDEITENRLRSEFSRFGEISSVKIMVDEKRNSKGFGFVCFSTPEEAQRAIVEMNGRTLAGCTKPLYVALHEPRDIRRQKLATQYAARIKSSIHHPGALYGHSGPMYFGGPGLSQNFVYATGPSGISGTRWSGSGQMPPGPQNFVSQNFGGSNRQARNIPRGPGMYISGAPQQQTRRANNPQEKRQNPQSGSQRSSPAKIEPVQVGGSSEESQDKPADEVISQENQVRQSSLEEDDTPLSLDQLSLLQHEQQKLLIGEKLYPLVLKKEFKWAGKITGMLLESTNVADLLSLLSDDVALSEKVQVAIGTLNANSAKK
eukprot:TRINITY_DN7037_c0_g1_i1.p1 TRINITY_DN7037_c0_g1~~TRINITY_DN7037_c0_g1_i1.p1  ORF type:complete len:636 (-),score=132.88 TRINITY_DN7037_c0_g1_i1:34-1881(-)